MFGCDMLVAIGGGSQDPTPVGILDIYSENHAKPESDSQFYGGRYDVYDISGIWTPSGNTGTIDVNFKRKLDTGDLYDKPIVPGQKIDMNWAYKKTGDGFGEHSDYGAGEIEFTRISDPNFSTAPNEAGGLGLHGLTMTACWLVLVPVAI